MTGRALVVGGAAFALLTASWGGLVVFLAVVVVLLAVFGRVTR